MAIVISTTATSALMYGILKLAERILKSKGIEMEDYHLIKKTFLFY